MLYGGLVQHIAVVSRTPTQRVGDGSGATDPAPATQDSSLTSGIAGEQEQRLPANQSSLDPDAPCEQGVKRSARVSFPEPVDGAR